jgi:hypothetical protein
MLVAACGGVITRYHVEPTPVTDRFFENHLAGVRARLEVQTRKAIERQRMAWREMLQREALLEGKEFQQADPD